MACGPSSPPAAHLRFPDHPLRRLPRAAAPPRGHPPLGPGTPARAVGRAAPRSPPRRSSRPRRRRRRSWTWCSTDWRASTPAAPTAGRWGSFLAGTRQTPPERALQGPRCSVTARTSPSARCRRPRSTWRSPRCASWPRKPPRTSCSPRKPPPPSSASEAPGVRASGPATG